MSVLLFALLPLLAQDTLRSEAITRFDGQRWAGIRLNRDTDADIKRVFRTEKGAVRPEALKIVTDQPRDVRVDTLLDGRGGKAVVRAIRVEYMFGAPKLSELEDAYNERGEELYLPGRNDDWSLVSFPKQGVLVFSLKGLASVFYLASPEGIARATGDFRDRPTPVVPVPDPGAGWDQTVTFGDSSVTLFIGDNAPGDFDEGGRRRMRDAVSDSLEGVRGRGLRYARRDRGTIAASVRTSKFDDDGSTDCTVALSLTSTTPYGKIEKTVSRNRKIRPRYRDAILNLTDDAMDALKIEVANAIRHMGPPSPERTREDAMQRLYGALTG
ncbi:hypothetical protein BH11ARM2_BH11ARM2_28430 [soil metagenome]